MANPSEAAAPKPDAFVRICPSRAVLARVGEKWTTLALVALASGPLRFGALRRRLEGVSQKMLSQTLRNLERDGLVARVAYDERLPRVEYRVTERGRTLLPWVVGLKAWAEENLKGIEQSNAAFDGDGDDGDGARLASVAPHGPGLASVAPHGPRGEGLGQGPTGWGRSSR